MILTPILSEGLDTRKRRVEQFFLHIRAGCTEVKAHIAYFCVHVAFARARTQHTRSIRSTRSTRRTTHSKRHALTPRVASAHTHPRLHSHSHLTSMSMCAASAPVPSRPPPAPCQFQLLASVRCNLSSLPHLPALLLLACIVPRCPQHVIFHTHTRRIDRSCECVACDMLGTNTVVRLFSEASGIFVLMRSCVSNAAFSLG